MSEAGFRHIGAPQSKKWVELTTAGRVAEGARSMSNPDPFDEAVNPFEASEHSHTELGTGGVDTGLATRSQRLVAAIVDSFISVLAIGPLMYFTGYFERVTQQEVTVLETASLGLAGFVLFVILHGYPLATRGQTLGKMLIGIRIVDYTDDRLLPFGRLLALRYLPISVIANIPIPLVGQGLSLINVLMIFGSEQRCGHDLIAGTKVVKAR